MIPGVHKQRCYTRAQLRLLMFMDRCGLDAGACDEVMLKQYPRLPGWYDSLMDEDMITPVERLDDQECEQVQRAVGEMARLLGRRGG